MQAPKRQDAGSRDTDYQGCSSWDVWDAGSRDAGSTSCRDTGTWGQGLLLPEDPCVWDVGDRSTPGGNTLGASSQEMPKQGCAGVLQHLG